MTEKSQEGKKDKPIIHWFIHLGMNWCRCALAVYLIFDPEAHEYAIALMFGPFCFMFGIEEDPSKANPENRI